MNEELKSKYGFTGDGEYFVLGVSVTGEDTDVCLNDVIKEEDFPSIYDILSKIDFVGSYDEIIYEGGEYYNDLDHSLLENIIIERSINLNDIESIIGCTISEEEYPENIYLIGYEFEMKDTSKKPLFVLFEV